MRFVLNRVPRALIGGTIALAAAAGTAVAASRVPPPGVYVHSYSGIACPARSLCVAVGNKSCPPYRLPTSPRCGGNPTGRVVVFDPAAPARARAFKIDASAGLQAVACPSVAQCTAVDTKGMAATFSPSAPQHTVLRRLLDSHRQLLTVIACPSPSECIALDAIQGRVVTFDPRARGARPTIVRVGGPLAFGRILACPSRRQCTVVDLLDREITFNPRAPGPLTPRTIEHAGPVNGPTALSCPSTSACVAVDNQGREIAFDPRSGAVGATFAIDGTLFLNDIACWSARRCTAVDAFARALTFDPVAPGHPPADLIDRAGLAVVGGTAQLELACPLVSRCVVVDTRGNEVTFDPRSGKRHRPHQI